MAVQITTWIATRVPAVITTVIIVFVVIELDFFGIGGNLKSKDKKS